MHTRRLTLRPFTLDDADAYWPLAALPEMVRYTGETAPASIEQVRQILLTRPLRDYAVHGFGRLACIEKDGGRLVGFCGLKQVDALGEVDIGYRFLPDTWGKGYATESARCLIDHGLQVLGLRRIVATVHPDNGASIRVLQKLGLHHERVLAADEDGVAMQLFATAPPA